ncbi:UNVERIFIED_CONTAM: hypothetical protein FKN15_024314 [Acipenser sinensis]
MVWLWPRPYPCLCLPGEVGEPYPLIPLVVPGVRSRRSSRPLRYSRQGLAQEIQHLRQLGGIHFDVHCFQGAVPVNPTSDTTCERVPAEGAVPRGLLISNDNTAPRENTRSGKQQMRAHLQVGPERRQPSQTPVLAPQPPPPTLHQPPPPETSRTPSIASPHSSRPDVPV